MEVARLTSSILPRQPLSLMSRCPKRPISLIVAAGKGTSGRDYGGRLVDENMIVLRMRIRDIKILEANYKPPSDWMQWEKQYFACYNEDVCEAIRCLQIFFMNIRPSLALGILAVVALAVPISTGMVLFHALEIARGILSGFLSKLM